jgi:hypothetical protein
MRTLVIAILLLVATRLSAQQQRGRVLLADSTTPAAGAVIEAVLESDATVRARALASRDGNYQLRLPRAGNYKLSGLRIGYVPTEFGVVSFADGENKTQQLILTNTAVRLAVVRVDARTQCGRDIAGGSTVASLLTQVRTALGAATLVSTDGGAQAEWRTHRLIVDHRRVPLAGPWDSVRTGATQRPFTSVGVLQLSNEGFVRLLDDGVEYRAPDAEILLSEWFLGTHCYAVVEDRDQPELIGLRFTPARLRSQVTDISGTLWLTRAGTKLERIDFGYVGLPRYLDVANPGGSMRFAQLSDGSWIVQAWELRMPRPVQRFLIGGPDISSSEVPMVVASTEHVGGQVARVRRDTTTLFSTDVEPLVKRFPALATPEVMPSCPSALAYDADTRGLVFGLISTSRGSLPRATRAEIAWRAPPNRNLPQSERLQIRLLDAPDGFFMLCGLPFGSGISVKATAPGYEQGDASTRLSTRQPTARMPIVLAPDTTTRR